MENKSDNIYLFYPKNQKFIDGKSNWTEQGKKLVFELIFAFPLILLLFTFLIWWGFDFWIKLLLLALFGCIVLVPLTIYFLKLQNERKLSKEKRIISGVILSCELTNKGSDYDIFEIKYSFGSVKSSFQIQLNRNKTKYLVGKQILVLYSDDGNHMVL
jgi:hypothetical protein